MSKPLTCWKEIAHYLGKGVRTVQRWEQDLDLPVRRPSGQDKRRVLAFSDEIDAWMSSHFQPAGKSDVEDLRRELAELRKQNELLRARLERAERTASFVQLSTPSELEHWIDNWLRERCFLALERSNTIRLQAAELIDKSRSMQELVRTQRKQRLMPSYDMQIH